MEQPCGQNPFGLEEEDAKGSNTILIFFYSHLRLPYSKVLNQIFLFQKMCSRGEASGKEERMVKLAQPFLKLH